ncbi:MAG: IclR family transcriptional regulator [Pseudomonadota bacterium]
MVNANISHRVPAIDRMMELLGVLSMRGEGVSMTELADHSGLSRSTVYRLLNSLEAHGLVARGRGYGRFVLGTGFLGLADKVRERLGPKRLVALARPHLDRLSAKTGEVSKLSVFDADRALCIAAANGNTAYSLLPQIGQHYPIHAGAASKVLLAAIEQAERNRILSQRLATFTKCTVTKRATLEAELEQVRALGWAEDRGEYQLSVRAVAAAVKDQHDDTLAAVSIAYLADHPKARRLELRQAVVDAAAELNASL